MPSPSSLLAAVTRVRASLEDIAQALAAVRLDDLLSGQEKLASALAGFPPSAALDMSERESILREVEFVSATCRRCERLGASFADIVRISVGALGLTTGYDRAGRTRADVRAATLSTRV